MPEFLIEVDSTVRETLEITAENMQAALLRAHEETGAIRMGRSDLPLANLFRPVKRQREVFFSHVKVTKLDG